MTLFWNVTFPYHARSYENHGKTKYVHIVCALLGVFAPLVPITIVISVYSTQYQEQHANTTSPVNPFVSGGLGFGLSIYHPVLCFCTDRDVGFYSFVLPLEIFVGIGCSLLLITFWSIRRVSIISIHYMFKSNVNFNYPACACASRGSCDQGWCPYILKHLFK